MDVQNVPVRARGVFFPFLLALRGATTETPAPWPIVRQLIPGVPVPLPDCLGHSGLRHSIFKPTLDRIVADGHVDLVDRDGRESILLTPAGHAFQDRLRGRQSTARSS